MVKDKSDPLIISGPCSAETEEQVINTALQLSQDSRIKIFRAGIWKPRTRPGTFEGVGTEGLKWLNKVQDLTGLPVTVEVAKTSHVEDALNHNIDVLWLGARTTANPFAVQEIADALRGVKIPVLVKNPINPDIGLWIGAVERLESSGIDEIGAIHRGFSFSNEKVFRNRPQWQIPIEFKEERPEIPMIVDPSHICGNRSMLSIITQKALDLDYDGVMMETHIDPDNAWSDARQQITPERFTELLDNLVLRSYDPLFDDDAHLRKLRNEIDNIDDELLNILANRMTVSQQIGAYKRDNKIMILQPKRWKMIFEKYLTRADQLEINKEFVERIFRAIHDESIDKQTNGSVPQEGDKK